MIPAGRATLEVETAPRERMVLRATARSLQWIDWMYLVRERMESTVTVPGLLPERLFKTTRDGRHRTRVEELLFDRRAGTVTYRRDEQEQASLEVTPGARDALASFYAFRTLDFEGEEVELDITDGKKVVTGIVKVLGRDKIRTPAGTFQTIKIEPRIEGVGGVIKKSSGARLFIWLTDDEWRRPVKVRTRVALGRVTAVLTGFSRGDSKPAGVASAASVQHPRTNLIPRNDTLTP